MQSTQAVTRRILVTYGNQTIRATTAEDNISQARLPIQGCRMQEMQKERIHCSCLREQAAKSACIPEAAVPTTLKTADKFAHRQFFRGYQG